MTANTTPIFSRLGDIEGAATLLLAPNDYTGQAAGNAVVYTADQTNGGFVQRLRFKALGSNVASVARIYINNGLGSFASMASAAQTPTGTPSSSGGTLATGTYYAKIIAVDQYGACTAAGTESAGVSVTGPTGSIAWAWTASTAAVSYIICVGVAAGAEQTYFTSSTNSFSQTAPIATASSPYGPTTGKDTPNGLVGNNWFYGEVALPLTTAIATTSTADVDYPMNIALAPGYRIIAGLGTAVAAGWAVTVIAGKY